LIEKLLDNIYLNSLFPIRVNGKTLHIYYEGVWHLFDTEEEERLYLVKPLIEKSLDEERVKSKLISSVHTELLTLPHKMERYVDDKENIYINLKNKLLKLDKDGNIYLLEHSAELGFRWKLDFDYNEKAECPLFMKFLGQVIGDSDTILAFQEFLGYVFLPHNHLNIEVSLWLYGKKGGNGKSVITSLLPFIYGEENISYLDPGEFGKDEKRVMLKGKLLNISSDASNKIDPSSFKKMASGEKMTSRELYKGTSVLKSLPKLIVATNDMPKVTSGIAPFLRRVILIPFTATFKENERDLHLGKKLKGEIPGIFNFALEGLQRLLKQRHFTHSKVIDDALTEYYGELDIMDDFLADNPIEKLVGKGVAHISQTDLFKRAQEWCKSMGKRNSYTSPRSMRDKLIDGYEFLPYKNNSIYGIKGRWKKPEEMSREAHNADYEADEDIQDIYTSADITKEF